MAASASGIFIASLIVMGWCPKSWWCHTHILFFSCLVHVVLIRLSCPKLLLISVASAFPEQQNIDMAAGFREHISLGIYVLVSWAHINTNKNRIFLMTDQIEKNVSRSIQQRQGKLRALEMCGSHLPQRVRLASKPRSSLRLAFWREETSVALSDPPALTAPHCVQKNTFLWPCNRASWWLTCMMPRYFSSVRAALLLRIASAAS